MENTLNTKEIEERAKYQRAIYNRHKCDLGDVELQKHFDQIIATYEATHKTQDSLYKGALSRQFSGRSLA